MLKKFFQSKPTCPTLTQKGCPHLKEGYLEDEETIKKLFHYLANTTAQERIIFKHNNDLHKTILIEFGQYRGFQVTSIEQHPLELGTNEEVEIIFFAGPMKLEAWTSVMQIPTPGTPKEEQIFMTRPPKSTLVKKQERKACRVRPPITNFEAYRSGILIRETEFGDLSVTGISFFLSKNERVTPGTTIIGVNFTHKENTFALEGRVKRFIQDRHKPGMRRCCLEFIKGRALNSVSTQLNAAVIDGQKTHNATT